MIELLHTIDFIEREEYIEEDYPEHVYSTNAHTKLPTPSKGEVVTFGWHTENGNRVERVDLHEVKSTSDVGYETSKEYQVVAVDHHYHMEQKTGSDGKLAVNRNEVSTTVVIEEYDND